MQQDDDQMAKNDELELYKALVRRYACADWPLQSGWNATYVIKPIGSFFSPSGGSMVG